MPRVLLYFYFHLIIELSIQTQERKTGLNFKYSFSLYFPALNIFCQQTWDTWTPTPTSSAGTYYIEFQNFNANLLTIHIYRLLVEQGFYICFCIGLLRVYLVVGFWMRSCVMNCLISYINLSASADYQKDLTNDDSVDPVGVCSHHKCTAQIDITTITWDARLDADALKFMEKKIIL